MRLQISPTISYYLRKLLRQNLDRIELDTQPSSDVGLDATSDLNGVLDRLYADEVCHSSVVREIEHLVLVHQTLNSQGALSQPEVQKTELRLFELMGYCPKSTTSRKGTILVIDDVQSNLNLLTSALNRQGYRVMSAITGRGAINALQDAIPDLILLDIMLPDANGYSVCEQFKKYTLTRDVPVIFITAMQDTPSKVKAFGAGGADYITKPFQLEEVLVRVDHQLQLRDLQKRLEAQNIRFQEELQKRQTLEAHYRRLFERATEGMFQSTIEGRYLQVNPALVRLYGYDSATDLITSLDDIATQLYVEPGRREQLNQELLDRGQLLNAVSEVRHKHGSTLWICENVYQILDTRGNRLHYEGTVRTADGLES